MQEVNWNKVMSDDVSNAIQDNDDAVQPVKPKYEQPHNRAWRRQQARAEEKAARKPIINTSPNGLNRKTRRSLIKQGAQRVDPTPVD